MYMRGEMQRGKDAKETQSHHLSATEAKQCPKD